MAYTAAHTGYIPFDYDASQIFSLQKTNNYLVGEWLLSLLIFSTPSHFGYPVASFVQGHFIILFLMLIHGNHQALILYDHAITLDKEVRSLYFRPAGNNIEAIRLRGFGRLSNKFNLPTIPLPRP
jgi:hypothetical protein